MKKTGAVQKIQRLIYAVMGLTVLGEWWHLMSLVSKGNNNIVEVTPITPAKNEPNTLKKKELLINPNANPLVLFDVPSHVEEPTRELIADPDAKLQQEILTRRLVYLTFGENCCAKAKVRACSAFHGVHETAGLQPAALTCMACSSSDIDQAFKDANAQIFANHRGYAYFLWKPYLINKTLHSMQEGDYLIYMDAGAYLVSPIHPLLVLLERKKYEVLTFGVGLSQGDFCKRDAFVRQKCDTPACHDAMQVNAAFSIWKRGAAALALAESWLRDSADYHTISDDANVEGLPDLPGFKSHRHDQATITNVLTRDHYARDTTNGPALFMIVHDRDIS